MNTTKPIAAAWTIAAALLAAAPALSQNAYFQIDGGASFLSETDLGDGVDADYDVGFTAGGRIGTNISDNVRVELDVSYAANDFDTVGGLDLGSLGLDADLSVLTFGVGIYADITNLAALTPYLGGGAGGAYKEINTNFGGDDEDTGLTAHGEAGLSLKVTPNISAVPHYRLAWLDEVGDDAQFAHWFRLGIRLGQ